MKKLLYLLLLLPGVALADPRFPLPQTPSEIWQNDLDLRDLVIENYVTASSAAVTYLNTSGPYVAVSTAGEVTQPSQPCFLVRYTNASNVTGDGTAYTVQFDTEVYDVGEDFNVGTYTFTAPVTGKYLLSVVVGCTGVASTMQYVELKFITSNRTYLMDFAIGSAASPGYNGTAQSVIADMDAGDTAYVVVEVGGGTKVVDVNGGTYSHFSGSLIN